MFQNINTKIQMRRETFITLKAGVKIQAFANPQHHQGLLGDLVFLLYDYILCIFFFQGRLKELRW